LDKNLCGDLAHGFIKGQHESGLDAEGLNGGEALGEVLDEAGGVFGCEHLGGVFSKSNAERRGLELVRIGDGLPEDLLMAQMDAIKEADGAADAAVGRLHFAGVV